MAELCLMTHVEVEMWFDLVYESRSLIRSNIFKLLNNFMFDGKERVH